MAGDLRAARLRGDRGQGVDRVVVAHAGQHMRGVDGLAAIERHDEGQARGQALQQVHAVADGTGRGRIRRYVGVPGGPGLASMGQEAGVAPGIRQVWGPPAA
ncbi:hypothetical protein G6F23_015523 [Rhizopus arrhizus]|nr:hypothetical protein G6F23_015523 [Rhizopus arrhizus]